MSDSDEGCWTKCKDGIEYDFIRLKTWLKRKKDLTEGLQFDPSTGEMVLTGAEIPEEELADYAETEVTLLTYAKDLHEALSFLWSTISYTGRWPFKVKLEESQAVIRVDIFTFAYVMNVFMMIFLWILTLWIGIGLVLIFLWRQKEGTQISQQDSQLQLLQKQTTEYRLFKRLWLEIWFFYTTLIHLAYSTTNQWYFGRDYALFVKKWYKALDNAKVSVHENLREFILFFYGLGLTYVLGMIIVFSCRERFPSMMLTCQIFVAALAIPYTPYEERNKTVDGRMYFERLELEIFVLLLYCSVVLISWQNCIIHLTFCRMFRNGIRAMNQRVRMILQPFEEPAIGPNAVRINIENVRLDYVNVVIAGLLQNKVFGLVLVSDMLWTILTILFEALVLTFYGNEDPAHPEYLYRFRNNYEGTKIHQLGPPEAYLANALGHIVTTGIRLFIVIWIPDQVSGEAYKGYQSATEKGMVFAESGPERNFIRSIWLISVPRYPVVMTAKNYFKLTRGMICAMLASAFTFYIFSMQARNELSRVIMGNWPDIPLSEHVNLGNFSHPNI